MESLYLLIPIAIVIVTVAVFIFFWAVKSGQYDDLDTEAHRILFDDAPLGETQQNITSPPTNLDGSSSENLHRSGSDDPCSDKHSSDKHSPNTNAVDKGQRNV